MGPELERDALDFAMNECALALAVVGWKPVRPLLEAITRRTVKAYISHHRGHRANRQHQPHPDTVELSKLLPGQAFERESLLDRGAWRDRMRTARKLMANPEARWSVSTYKGMTILTRLPDGTQPRRNPYTNERAVFLSSFAPGETKLADCFKDRQSMSTNLKVAARRILNYPLADWSARTTAEGVLVRRVR